jgi:uncharacterized protein
MRNANEREKESSDGKALAIWLALVLALTVSGALPFILGGVPLNKLSPSWRFFGVAFAGIELTAYAPTLAALPVAGLFPGAGGARTLLRQIRTWRVGAGWYALALLGPVILQLFANTLHIVLGGAAPKVWTSFPSLSGFGPGTLTFFIGMLIAGSFGEELGWRGFALPRLQKRFSALTASLLIAILWTAWHLWPAMTPGGLAMATPAEAGLTLLRLTAVSIIFTWMYNSSGSLFVVMLAHAGLNIAATVVQKPADSAHDILILLVTSYLVVALALLFLKGSALSNGVAKPVNL